MRINSYLEVVKSIRAPEMIDVQFTVYWRLLVRAYILYWEFGEKCMGEERCRESGYLQVLYYLFKTKFYVFVLFKTKVYVVATQDIGQFAFDTSDVRAEYHTPTDTYRSLLNVRLNEHKRNRKNRQKAGRLPEEIKSPNAAVLLFSIRIRMFSGPK